MKSTVLLAVGLVVALGAQPASAQDLRSRDPRADELRRLQEEITRMKEKLQDIEARIKKAESTPARRGPGPAFGGGFGRGGGFGQPARRGFQGFQGFGGSSPRQVGFRGFSGPFGRRSAGSPSMKNVEDKLDRVIQELERLRNEMRRR